MFEKFTVETIKYKDLIPGYAYLWKDGHINIFLGFNIENGDFIFYSIGSYKVYNSKLQLKYQKELCMDVMKTTFDETNLKYYKSSLVNNIKK